VHGPVTRAGALLALAAGVLLACASDADQPDSEHMIAVTGRVVATGSDPFVILVIFTNANEQYELVGERADPLWDLQQQHLTVRGRVVRDAAGPGFPAQLEVNSYTLEPRPG
jgi:hypothetical protein